MNIPKIKIDPAKALSVGVTVLGLVGTLLTNKVEANNRKAMKEEILNELKKEVTSDN